MGTIDEILKKFTSEVKEFIVKKEEEVKKKKEEQQLQFQTVAQPLEYKTRIDDTTEIKNIISAIEEYLVSEIKLQTSSRETQQAVTNKPVRIAPPAPPASMDMRKALGNVKVGPVNVKKTKISEILGVVDAVEKQSSGILLPPLPPSAKDDINKYRSDIINMVDAVKSYESQQVSEKQEPDLLEITKIVDVLEKFLNKKPEKSAEPAEPVNNEIIKIIGVLEQFLNKKQTPLPLVVQEKQINNKIPNIINAVEQYINNPPITTETNDKTSTETNKLLVAQETKEQLEKTKSKPATRSMVATNVEKQEQENKKIAQLEKQVSALKEELKNAKSGPALDTIKQAAVNSITTAVNTINSGLGESEDDGELDNTIKTLGTIRTDNKTKELLYDTEKNAFALDVMATSVSQQPLVQPAQPPQKPSPRPAARLAQPAPRPAPRPAPSSAPKPAPKPSVMSIDQPLVMSIDQPLVNPVSDPSLFHNTEDVEFKGITSQLQKQGIVVP